MAASDFLWSILSLEGRVVWFFFCAIDDSWFELVAEFIDQLRFIVLPDCVSQVVDQFPAFEKKRRDRLSFLAWIAFGRVPLSRQYQ